MHRAAWLIALVAVSTFFASWESKAGQGEPAVVPVALKKDQPPFKATSVAALAQAIAAGNVDRIRQLARSADLSIRGDQDVTLLEWAIWNQKPAALAALLESGADSAQLGMDRETVAHMAAMVKDPRYLKVLIKHKAAIDVVSPRADRTPIFRAVESRRDEQVALLIKAGAKINRADSMGDTLLHLAGNINDADRALQLLKAGVDPRALNKRGRTFQAALFMGSDDRLNAAGKAARQRVRDWLVAHGIALE